VGHDHVHFPRPGAPWLLPARSWHADYGWDFYPEPLFGVKVFAFVAEVGPRGGGTLVITGSHRVTARFAAALPQGQPFAGAPLAPVPARGRMVPRADPARG
jgi:hypothetical protein